MSSGAGSCGTASFWSGRAEIEQAGRQQATRAAHGDKGEMKDEDVTVGAICCCIELIYCIYVNGSAFSRTGGPSEEDHAGTKMELGSLEA